MAERAPLEVTAVVVEGRGARDPVADLHAQLEEAKAAAIAAADRMQSLLQQMAMMEAAAAERRLAELNVRAELNRQQLACADQQAATSSTSRSVLVEPPQPAGEPLVTPYVTFSGTPVTGPLGRKMLWSRKSCSLSASRR